MLTACLMRLKGICTLYWGCFSFQHFSIHFELWLNVILFDVFHGQLFLTQTSSILISLGLNHVDLCLHTHTFYEIQPIKGGCRGHKATIKLTHHSPADWNVAAWVCDSRFVSDSITCICYLPAQMIHVCPKLT